MKAVLKCRLSSGDVVEVHPYVFSKTDFKDAEIISGEKYYIEKAVELGAVKPKAKRKTKAPE
jgi:hypothetical protein